jgi:hypothetical protein
VRKKKCALVREGRRELHHLGIALAEVHHRGTGGREVRSSYAEANRADAASDRSWATFQRCPGSRTRSSARRQSVRTAALQRDFAAGPRIARGTLPGSHVCSTISSEVISLTEWKIRVQLTLDAAQQRAIVRARTGYVVPGGNP